MKWFRHMERMENKMVKRIKRSDAADMYLRTALRTGCLEELKGDLETLGACGTGQGERL